MKVQSAGLAMAMAKTGTTSPVDFDAQISFERQKDWGGVFWASMMRDQIAPKMRRSNPGSAGESM